MNSLGYSLDFEDENSEVLGKLKTPSEVINIVTGGGFDYGKVVTAYGESRSGKSTFMYQMASDAMNEDPNTFLFIIDCESAIQVQRLKNAFNMDMSRVRIARAPNGISKINTVEDACSYCIKLSKNLIKATTEYKYTRDQLEEMSDKDLVNILEGIEKNLSKYFSHIKNEWRPLNKNQMINELLIRGEARASKTTLQKFIVIWDTIAASTIRESDTKLGEGNSLSMRDNLTKPKVIKDWLPKVVASMSGLPMSLLIINQVSTGMNKYGYTYETMSGGLALYHESDVVIHTKIESRTQTPDGLGEFTFTAFNLEKSRQSTRVSDISLAISEKLFGRIVNPEREIYEFAKSIKVIDGKNRYSIKDISGNFDVSEPRFLSYYEKDLKYWYPILKEKCIAKLRANYLSVDLMYKESNDPSYGDPKTVDKKLFNWDKPSNSTESGSKPEELEVISDSKSE